MKTNSARCEFTERALRDIERHRQFLRRNYGSRPRARIRAVVNAIRFIQDSPKLRPVEGISLTGLELRRYGADQFVVVYSYFEPSPTDRDGFVSIRAIRHGREEDVLFGVEESCAGLQLEGPSFLRLE